MWFVSNRDNIDKGPIYQFSSFFFCFFTIPRISNARIDRNLTFPSAVLFYLGVFTLFYTDVGSGRDHT